jgi:hypothetical protein
MHISFYKAKIGIIRGIFIKKSIPSYPTMKKEVSTRTERYSFLVNPDEKQMIENYLRKYKIQNRSRWMRETLVTFIIKNLDQDYPTLFDEQEMRR